MTMTHYEKGEGRRDSRLVMAMMVVNAAFAVTALYWWTALSLLVGEPMKWATWRGISIRPDPLEYPYILLWMVPFLGICFSWLAQKSGKLQVARFCGVYPIAFLGSMCGWYYLAPMGWR